MPSRTLSALTQRGLMIYAEKLQSTLEPAHNNRYVAIHVPSEDYSVGQSSGEAIRELLKRHPVDGQVVIRKIGSEPDYGMASRVLAGELQAESRG